MIILILISKMILDLFCNGPFSKKCMLNKDTEFVRMTKDKKANKRISYARNSIYVANKWHEDCESMSKSQASSFSELMVLSS